MREMLWLRYRPTPACIIIRLEDVALNRDPLVIQRYPKVWIDKKSHAINTLIALYEQAGLIDFPYETAEVRYYHHHPDKNQQGKSDVLAAIAYKDHEVYIFVPDGDESVVDYLLADMEDDDYFYVFTPDNFRAFASRADTGQITRIKPLCI